MVLEGYFQTAKSIQNGDADSIEPLQLNVELSLILLQNSIPQPSYQAVNTILNMIDCGDVVKVFLQERSGVIISMEFPPI